jgi:TolB-like protein
VSETIGQRRLAAVLIADVVGYSRLMEADEAGTLMALKERRKGTVEPLVREHKGRIVKVMGDGVLIEFASAVNALACALAVQKAMAEANAGLPENRRIELRIGINLGDLIGEGSDIYGDGVNIAARLETLAEPGGICISGKLHDEVSGKLAFAAEDMGEVALKNIARPVRVYRAVVPTQPGAAVSTGAKNAGPTGTQKVSIAVLPFTNMSGDPEREYFADGLTEDLITALAKSRHLSVLSRNTTFQYKGRAMNVADLGRHLGALYVLEGSVRTGANRVRVTAQLIETASGSHVWAERFDRELTDIFAVQDEIVAAISAQLAFSVVDASVTAGRSAPTSSLTAYDHLLRGRAAWRRGAVAETHTHWTAAVELDPNYAAALASLAFLYAEDTYMQMLGIPLDKLRALAEEYAERAIAMDDGDAYAQHMVGTAWLTLGQLDRAKQHLELAIRLNPHYPSSIINLGCTLGFMGQYREGMAMIETAFRLEPRLPPAMRAVPFYVHCIMGDADSALADLAKIESPYAFLHLWMGACLSGAGRDAEARRHIHEFEQKRPPWFDVPGFAESVRRCIRSEEDRDRFMNGLHKAGFAV